MREVVMNDKSNSVGVLEEHCQLVDVDETEYIPNLFPMRRFRRLRQ